MLNEKLNINISITNGVVEGIIDINGKKSNISAKGGLGYSDLDCEFLNSEDLSTSNEEFIDDLTSALHNKVMSYYKQLSCDNND